MPTIDDSIRKIDAVICRHLDAIGDSSRGAISQDILEQLMKFTGHIMLKFYANGRDIDITEENISHAAEYAQTNSELSTLYKFHNFLQAVTAQFTLDEDGSERLMLKYYQYLLEAKNLLSRYYGMEILHNLDKFPLHQDDTLQEYYKKIAAKIDLHPAKPVGAGNAKYYVQKIKPLFVENRIYYEITFMLVDDRKNRPKANRVIAFTGLPVKSNYACKFHLVQESIEILGKTMPVIIIDGWEVSIRDCEFQNFIALIMENTKKVPYPEQRLICGFLTQTGFTLTDLTDFPDAAYDSLAGRWQNSLRSSVFIPALSYCRQIIRGKRPGQNMLRYLLYNMNNVIIRNQHSNVQNQKLSGLFLQNGCIPFDSLPFNQSPIGHNPKLGAIFDCIPHRNRQPEMFARLIRNNTEGRGQLFTDIGDISGYQNIPELIRKYNERLWYGHRPRSGLRLEHDQVFISGYNLDTCEIIKKLQELSASGIEGYEADVDFWQFIEDYDIDCEEKRSMIGKLFSQSKVGVIYGSAGVGKSTLINHVSHYLNDKQKLYLTQTNPAKENLMRKIDAENTTFSTIASFLKKDSTAEYELLVIDECSTVSNSDMVQVLAKASFKMLLLVGDTYQIDAIQFGNWFSVLKSFLPERAVFELTRPHRTQNRYLLELWDKVRHMDEDAKECIERESYSLKVDASLLSSVNPDEAILCLNYDGLYGINNINRFLQESNPNPAVRWDVQQYKVGDPILFLDTDRFYPAIYNNMKGIIRRIAIVDEGGPAERIRFDVEVPKAIQDYDAIFGSFQLLECDEEKEQSLIRFDVYKMKSADEDGDDSVNYTIVPFQVAYAVSIHKAQGLEYNSVKIVITDEVEELVTHNVFYTAVTRAREKLKIYWTPEVEEKVISRIRPRDINKDVEILKYYL